MSTASEVANGERVALAGLLQSRADSAAPRRKAQARAAQGSSDVVHTELAFQQTRRNAAAGQSLLHFEDAQNANPALLPLPQETMYTSIPGITEQNAMAEAAERAVLAFSVSTEAQSRKFKSEREKSDARFTTDQRGGRAEGKHVEGAHTAGLS